MHSVPFRLPSSLSVFAEAIDETLLCTAAGTAKHMRKLDRAGRANLFHKLWSKPLKFRRMVAAHFGPDELLEGTATGSEPADVVVLKGKLKRQTKIEHWFAKRPRTE